MPFTTSTALNLTFLYSSSCLVLLIILLITKKVKFCQSIYSPASQLDGKPYHGRESHSCKLNFENFKFWIGFLLKSFLIMVIIIGILVVTFTLVVKVPPNTSQSQSQSSSSQSPDLNFNHSHFSTSQKSSKARLYKALKLETISYGVENQNLTAFDLWKKFIIANYKTTILDHPLIEYKWFRHAALMIHLKPKSQKDSQSHLDPLKFKKLDPIAFIAHSDVVPVTAEKWSVPAFDPESADLKKANLNDGFIYGRGTIDMKMTYIQLLEALSRYLSVLDVDDIDSLIPSNHRPIFYVLTDDEEIGLEAQGKSSTSASSESSADKIRDYIFKVYQEKLNFEKFELTLDEGGAIFQKMVPGIDKPQAITGVCEKSYLDLEITVNSEGGHSSLATLENNAITRMNKVISTLNDKIEFITPFYLFKGVEAESIPNNLHEMGLLYRTIFANIWLTKPLIERVYRNSPTLASTIRSNMAFTILNSGEKANVAPQNAKMTINFRLHPNDSPKEIYTRVEQVLERLDFSSKSPKHGPSNPKKLKLLEIKNLTTLEQPFGGPDRCKISLTNTFAMDFFSKHVKNIYKKEKNQDIVVFPVLCPGGTDSRKFVNYSKATLRMLFTEFEGSKDLKGMHGNDERVAEVNFERGIRFYFNFLVGAAGGLGAEPGL